MDRGAWWATVHRVAKSWTLLKDRAHTHEHTHMCKHAHTPEGQQWTDSTALPIPASFLLSVFSLLCSCVFFAIMSMFYFLIRKAKDFILKYSDSKGRDLIWGKKFAEELTNLVHFFLFYITDIPLSCPALLLPPPKKSTFLRGSVSLSTSTPMGLVENPQLISYEP